MGGGCTKLLEGSSTSSLSCTEYSLPPTSTIQSEQPVNLEDTTIEPRVRFRWLIYVQKETDGDWGLRCSSTQPKANRDVAEIEGRTHLEGFHKNQEPNWNFKVEIEKVEVWENTTCMYKKTEV